MLTTIPYAAGTWKAARKRNGVPDCHPLSISQIAWARFLYSHKGCRVGLARCAISPASDNLLLQVCGKLWSDYTLMLRVCDSERCHETM